MFVEKIILAIATIYVISLLGEIVLFGGVMLWALSYRVFYWTLALVRGKLAGLVDLTLWAMRKLRTRYQSTRRRKESGNVQQRLTNSSQVQVQQRLTISPKVRVQGEMIPMEDWLRSLPPGGKIRLLLAPAGSGSPLQVGPTGLPNLESVSKEIVESADEKTPA